MLLESNMLLCSNWCFPQSWWWNRKSGRSAEVSVLISLTTFTVVHMKVLRKEKTLNILRKQLLNCKDLPLNSTIASYFTFPFVWSNLSVPWKWLKSPRRCWESKILWYLMFLTGFGISFPAKRDEALNFNQHQLLPWTLLLKRVSELCRTSELLWIARL